MLGIERMNSAEDYNNRQGSLSKKSHALCSDCVAGITIITAVVGSAREPRGVDGYLDHDVERSEDLLIGEHIDGSDPAMGEHEQIDCPRNAIGEVGGSRNTVDMDQPGGLCAAVEDPGHCVTAPDFEADERSAVGVR